MPTDLAHEQRILIVRLSALGDVVHVLPLLDVLRRARPDAHIGWLVEERAASLLEGHPQIDRLWIAPRREVSGLWRERRYAKAVSRLRETVRALRDARYEVTIDAQCNFRSSSWARISGAPRRIGFAPPYTKEKGHWLSTERVHAPVGGQLKVHRNLELLKAQGIDTGDARAVLPLPESARVSARALRQSIAAPRAIALHPGVSGHGAIKQWPLPRFAALARRLRDDVDARCLVTWGPEERALAEEVVAASEGAAELAPATGSLLELGALYEECDVVVGGDTGPLHLAAALGVPVVGLYGPKDPAIYGPWNGRTGTVSTIVWKQVHCSPCRLRRCGNVICMPAIQVDDVVAAVRRTLDDSAPRTDRSPRQVGLRA
jgi:lipopolysaccharide heptosyltransferase I